MYARIAEFQSTSKTNCDMMIAFLQNVMLPRNIANGQLSSEVFRINENSGFIVSKFNSKKDADKKPIELDSKVNPTTKIKPETV